MANEIYSSSWWGEGVCTNTIDWGSSYKALANCTPTPDPFNNTYSLAFDGVDDTINLGNVSSLNGSTSGSFSMWLKLNSTGIEGLMNQWGAGDDRLIYGFIWLGGGRIDLYISGNLAFRVSSNAVISSLSTGQWFNLVITYDGTQATSTDRVKAYIDNQELTGNIGGGPLSFFSSTTDFILGYYPSGTYIDGNIDEFAIFNTTLTPENITSIYNSGEPNDLTSLNPTLWLRNGDNGTFKSPQWLIPNNENKTKFSNYSFEYDGVDDYIDISNPTIFTNFTLSFWYKQIGGAGSFETVVGRDTITGGILTSIVFSSGLLHFKNRAGSWTALTTTAASNTEFKHYSITYNSSANELKGYCNGTLEVTTTPVFSGATGNEHSFNRIGSYFNSYYLNGYLDEVSVFNSALSVTDITTIYNSGVPTDISSLSPVGYWRSEQSYFTDNWLVDNSALSNYSTRSFAFDGVDDYINSGASTLSGETALSISAWVYPTAYGDATAPSFVSTDAASPRAFYLGLYNGTNFRFSMSTNGTNLNSLDTAIGTVTLNAWQHILVTWDKVNTKFYKNGVLLKTVATTFANNQDFTTTNDLLIGARRSSAGFFEGNIDEVAIWNSVQNASTIYNSGEPARIDGAVAHWRMGEDATFSTNWNVPDNVGSATGTSANMTIEDLEGNAPNYTGGGLSVNMTIEDRVGDASNSSNNALSYNMDEADRETEVPT